MGRLGGGELLLILLIALLIFGPSKLADMGKGLGEGLKNFKKGISQDKTDDKTDDETKGPEPTPPVAAEPAKALVAGSVSSGEPPASAGAESTVGTTSDPGPPVTPATKPN